MMELNPTDKAVADLLGEIEVDDARRGDAIYERKALVALINTLLAAMVERAAQSIERRKLAAKTNCADSLADDEELSFMAIMDSIVTEIRSLTPADAAQALEEHDRKVWNEALQKVCEEQCRYCGGIECWKREPEAIEGRGDLYFHAEEGCSVTWSCKPCKANKIRALRREGK